MLRVLVLSALLALAAAQREFACNEPAAAGDRRPARSALRIASLNAYWLFVDALADTPWSSPAAASAHVRDVARALAPLDADVIVLQEVEGCAALDALPQADRYRGIVVPGTDSATGQNVALLTRIDPERVWRVGARVAYPVAAQQCGLTGSKVGQSSSGVSKHVLARFAVAGLGPLLLVGAHLVAQPTAPARCAQREAQALVLANAIRAARVDEPQLAVLVAGDLNDFDPAFADVGDESPNSRALPFLRNATTPPLVNVAEFAPAESRFSYCSNNCRNPSW